MKKKIVILLSVLLVVTIGFSGCGDGSQLNFIESKTAQAIALKDAGLSEAQVRFVKAELERDDGRVYYDVEFYTENKEFDYEIDAKSGAILEKDFDAENYAPAISTSKPNKPVDNTAGKNTISADKAKEIALKQVPGAALSDIREFETDYDDGRLEYEGKIIYDKIEYEFEIDGETGAIRSWDAESVYD